MTDLYYATRQLARHSAFTVGVILLLSLGIGITATVYSFFRAVMLAPLRAVEPERLVRMVQTLPRVGTISSFPEAYLDALRTTARSFSAVFGAVGHFDRFVLSSPGPATEVSILGVTPEYFAALGIPARYGRSLSADDEHQAFDTIPAVLGYRFSRRHFAERADALLGATLIIGKRHMTVVGIMPEAFTGITTDTTADVWIPLRSYRQLLADSSDVAFEVGARLASTASIASARQNV